MARSEFDATATSAAHFLPRFSSLKSVNWGAAIEGTPMKRRQMHRRSFMAFVSAAAAWPVAVRAQDGSVPTIGYLGSESPQLFASRLQAFREGLASTGFQEGRNVKIEFEWAAGRNDALPALASELVKLKVAVLAAPGSLAAALAAKKATSTIPVVFETGADPVAAGLVESLNQPGGNVTGVTSLNAEVGPKRLELLHELLPDAKVFALLVNPTNPTNASLTTKDMQNAAKALGVELRVVNASTTADLDAAFTELTQQHVRGLVIANETFFANRSEQLAALALRYSMPAVHQSREFVQAGGLMSYGGSVTESHRQAGRYTGLILKGANPVDLPVQQVTKVDLNLNRKTAAKMGITLPLPLLGLADEVVE
jgi:putative tryptophan/tyrosine transport system substrate-binding protein